MLKLFGMLTNSNSPSSEKNVSSIERKRFTLTGKVVKNSLEKTATVIVVHSFRHSIYRKTISRYKKYLVHDSKNECQIGDEVLIASSRKISRHKTFFVVKILSSIKTTQNLKEDLKV